MKARRTLTIIAVALCFSSPTNASRLGSGGTKSGAPLPKGMVWINGHDFTMGLAGSNEGLCGGHSGMDDALPLHRVHVDGFWIDRTEVTNEQFARFVRDAKYVTVAERKPTKEEFPSAPEANLVAGALVFTPTPRSVPLRNHYRWWNYVPGADWRHPTGPDSSIKGRQKYPVVQLAYEDCEAYAKWAGKRLPTEAEWEAAARGGNGTKLYPWGDELKPDGKWLANIYQGTFPVAGKDTGDDGFTGIAPVAQYSPNGYGLYDMSGNVWEWVSDWYRPDYYATLSAAGDLANNPQGPATSLDPLEPGAQKRGQRGGSFLCTDQYCTRYMLGSRGKGEVKSGSNHVGFRCVKARSANSSQAEAKDSSESEARGL